MSRTLRAALALGCRGWSVFALTPGLKTPPARSSGCTGARRDPGGIRDLWDYAGPGAGLGVATGAPSGVWVLDIDTRAPDLPGAITGEQGIQRLAETGRVLADTLTAQTPRGGLHFYYLVPAGVDVRNRQNLRVDGIPTGIDVRGTGGYVVAPPTVIDLGAYAWSSARGVRPVEAPGWLLDLVRPAPPPPPVPRREWTGDHPYAVAVLDGVCGQVRERGASSDPLPLLQAATRIGHLVGGGHIREERARAELEAAASETGIKPRARKHAITHGLARGIAEPTDPPRR